MFSFSFFRNLGPYASLTVPYYRAKAHDMFDGTNYFQASVLAHAKMFKTFNYNFVYVDKEAVNLFFLHKKDVALAKWVELLSENTKVGVSIHKEDSIQKRKYDHICVGKQCKSSFHW